MNKADRELTANSSKSEGCPGLTVLHKECRPH